MVGKLQEELAEIQPQLEKAQVETEQIMEQIQTDTGELAWSHAQSVGTHAEESFPCTLWELILFHIQSVEISLSFPVHRVSCPGLDSYCVSVAIV